MHLISLQVIVTVIGLAILLPAISKANPFFITGTLILYGLLMRKSIWPGVNKLHLQLTLQALKNRKAALQSLVSTNLPRAVAPTTRLAAPAKLPATWEQVLQPSPSTDASTATDTTTSHSSTSTSSPIDSIPSASLTVRLKQALKSLLQHSGMATLQLRLPSLPNMSPHSVHPTTVPNQAAQIPSSPAAQQPAISDDDALFNHVCDRVESQATFFKKFKSFFQLYGHYSTTTTSTDSTPPQSNSDHEPRPVMTDGDIDIAVDRYTKFMRLVGGNTSGVPLAPTLDIDIVWHAHMLYPSAYARDSMALAGRVVHHMDTPHGLATRAQQVDQTADMWLLHYTNIPSGSDSGHRVVVLAHPSTQSGTMMLCCTVLCSLFCFVLR